VGWDEIARRAAGAAGWRPGNSTPSAAGLLSGGERQVALARALIREPR
jgi:ABC-type thiamine transport system ATPase subunit